MALEIETILTEFSSQQQRRRDDLGSTLVMGSLQRVPVGQEAGQESIKLS